MVFIIAGFMGQYCIVWRQDDKGITCQEGLDTVGRLLFSFFSSIRILIFLSSEYMQVHISSFLLLPEVPLALNYLGRCRGKITLNKSFGFYSSAGCWE